MSSSLLSIRFRNLYGNIATGLCLIALGVLRALDPTGPFFLACAVLLLVLAGANLRACLSKSREREDEMSTGDSGRAAAIALWSTLIAFGAACAFGMALEVTVDLAAVCFALVVYGAAFARLERGE